MKVLVCGVVLTLVSILAYVLGDKLGDMAVHAKGPLFILEFIAGIVLGGGAPIIGSLAAIAVFVIL